MKKIILISALLLCFTSAFAQNGKSIYQKYSDMDGVSAVYISPAMFRLMGRLPDFDVEGENVNLAPIIKSLTGLYIINSENAAINAKLAEEVNTFIDKGRFELLMEAKDNGETVRMYTEGTETIVNNFVMIAVDGSETSFICLDGKMNRDDLEKALASQMND